MRGSPRRRGQNAKARPSTSAPLTTTATNASNIMLATLREARLKRRNVDRQLASLFTEADAPRGPASRTCPPRRSSAVAKLIRLNRNPRARHMVWLTLIQEVQMSHGGRRAGAGRKPGSGLAKIDAAARKAAMESGITPLDYSSV